MGAPQELDVGPALAHEVGVVALEDAAGEAHLELAPSTAQPQTPELLMTKPETNDTADVELASTDVGLSWRPEQVVGVVQPFGLGAEETQIRYNRFVAAAFGSDNGWAIRVAREGLEGLTIGDVALEDIIDTIATELLRGGDHRNCACFAYAEALYATTVEGRNKLHWLYLYVGTPLAFVAWLLFLKCSLWLLGVS